MKLTWATTERDFYLTVFREPLPDFTSEQIRESRTKILPLLKEIKTGGSGNPLQVWNRVMVEDMMQPYYNVKDEWTQEEWTLLLSMETLLKKQGINVRVPSST
jgi:hypothetical protein